MRQGLVRALDGKRHESPPTLTLLGGEQGAKVIAFALFIVTEPLAAGRYASRSTTHLPAGAGCTLRCGHNRGNGFVGSGSGEWGELRREMGTCPSK